MFFSRGMILIAEFRMFYVVSLEDEGIQNISRTKINRTAIKI
jgi:hypothetical protein